MSLNKELLATIQQAGAAVFDADAQLKLAVKDYGERVHAAVGSNPFHLGNDTLFENWKMIARLSKTVASMEEDLRNVYRMVGELSDVEPSLPGMMPALTAPTPAASANSDAPLVEDNRLAATDVKIKKKARVRPSKPAKRNTGAKAIVKPATSPQAKALQTKRRPAAAAPVSGNAAKLLQHLGAVLSTKNFAAINQTAVSKATGIPLGSMTASLKRLAAAGHVQANHAGGFKLA
ncbi:hypothetical protein [Rhodoferax sp.]|uniref:hypothetical protein n=1 Tax=Rhodoferax sp. TaxID=50421 RepID=UPI0025E7C958|nr:hypothetical protein [Rhodoferax sp.]